MNYKYNALKLTAILLAGLMISGMAWSEEYKYFECKINMMDIELGLSTSCGVKNTPPCVGKTREYSIAEFKVSPTEYFQSGLIVNYESWVVTISRIDGALLDRVYKVAEKKSNLIIGNCELKTKNRELKF